MDMTAQETEAADAYVTAMRATFDVSQTVETHRCLLCGLSFKRLTNGKPCPSCSFEFLELVNL